MKAILLLAASLLCCFFNHLTAQEWERETLRTEIVGAWTRAGDFDLDGDPDILIQAGDSIYWHENLQPGWEIHLIDPTFYNSPYAWVDVQDLDGDGDPDVLKAPLTGQPPFALTWNENISGGASWQKHFILDAANFVGWMQGSYGDLDGDGDLDIVVPEYNQLNTGYLYWLENQANTGEYLQHFLKSGDAVASSVADIDGDGDLDVIVTQAGVSWLENQLPDTAWVEHPVEAPGAAIHLIVTSADLNGDNLPEIISDPLFAGNDKVVVFTNPGWQPVDINVAPGVLLGEVGDLDNDGDVDVTYGGTGFTGIPQALGWAENQDNGATWALHDITPANANQLFCSGLADFDGDGDLDMVSLDFNVATSAGSVFWAANPLINANSPRIRLHSVTTARQLGGDHGYTLDGIRMVDNSRPKLENPGYFGEAGIYPKSVHITDAYGDAGSLEAITGNNNIDLFYFGTFNKADPTVVAFSDAEIDSLYAWSKRGGKLLIGASAAALPFYDPSVLNAKWGFGIEFHPPAVPILPTEIGETSFIFEGPFGSISSANQGGAAQGIFNILPEDVVVLGVDANDNPTLVLDCATLDLIIVDNDAYTNLGGISEGPEIQNDNDRFWLNTIAYMDQLQGAPVVTQNGNSLSAGSYLTYQWMLDGQPVSGATDSIYTVTQQGNYSVSVSMSCGCPATSEEIFVVFTSVDDPLPTFEVLAFPNPASDFVLVQVKTLQPADFLVLVNDAQGRLLERRVLEKISATTVSLDLRARPAGVYFLTVGGESEVAVRRILKL